MLSVFCVLQMTFAQQWPTVAIELDLQAPEQRCFWAFAYIQKDLGARLGMTSGLASLNHLASSQASLESPHSFTNSSLFVLSFIGVDTLARQLHSRPDYE